MKIFLLLLIALLAACNSSDPGAAYVQGDRALMRSDSLMNVLVDLTERLKATPLTGDRDVDIVTELIEHHKATVKMNDVLLRDGTDQELKVFAQQLSEIQAQEIGKMQEFLDHHPPVSGAGRRGTPELMENLHSIEPTDSIEQAYVELLKMHLGYGIELARKEHERGLHEDMRQLAGELVRSGETMVAQLQEF